MSELHPHEKGLHVSWDRFHRDARALAWRLHDKGPDHGSWRTIVGITRGGMVPAMIVARELDVRTVDTICIKSYDHQSQSPGEVLKKPDAHIMGDGSGVIIIDDLVDSGKTMQIARSLYKEAHFATVYAKPLGEPQVDTFVTAVSQDTWVYFPWDTALQYVKPFRNVDTLRTSNKDSRKKRNLLKES